ncbi:MAG: beta-N-acetylhexosaminidase [Bacteroidales bacterium]|nr:beta-N-acetylhexosaminidase [Bacteroidales bacterium]
MRKILFLLSLVILISCDSNQDQPEPLKIIPQPVSYEVHSDFFKIDKETKIWLEGDVDLSSEADYLTEILNESTGFALPIIKDEQRSNVIILKGEKGFGTGNEAYDLDVSSKKIVIRASHKAGVFYGIQTLLQLFPPEVYVRFADQSEIKIPACSISDHPRFEWRGMHLDVSRHFFPVTFIKKYIDLIAMHKMNRFHWHLTDDNGWRIEIKKYPKLTEVAAWRVDREHESWKDASSPQPNEKATYGGFYTQDEIKEVVKYAAVRHVEVIPEIEMPGHTSEVFAAYPELSCTGEQLYVQPGNYWPNIDIFCAGKEETFDFIENVLTEVIDLFPSEYVHIGGDEATKDRWKACPLCQKRMKDEGLANEDELQSWFIKRVEKYLNENGKKLIGWDEIIDGGLAPEATVMSWRGFEGGIKAAETGHDVVMCPTSYCYFDYYQADPDFEPEAIGGLTTLKEVYSFEPVPSELNTSQAEHIVGAQGNLWTEYVATPEHAEYMVLPRMTALAEVVWSPIEKRDWTEFLTRLQNQFKRFDKLKLNYSQGSFKVDIQPSWVDGKYRIALETEQLNPEIRYNLSGQSLMTDYQVYEHPITIDSSVVVQAAIFADDSVKERPSVKEIEFHMAIGKIGSLKYEPQRNYNAKGVLSLTDGIKGTSEFRDGYWLGFQEEDMVFSLDLEQPVEIHEISFSFLQNVGSWILLPEKIHVEIFDADLQKQADTLITPETMPEVAGTLIEDYNTTFDGISGSVIRIMAENPGKLPSWHPYEGNRAWIFTDEIVLR